MGAQQFGVAGTGGQVEDRLGVTAVVPGARRAERPEKPQRRQGRRVLGAKDVAQRRRRLAGVQQIAHLETSLERALA